MGHGHDKIQSAGKLRVNEYLKSPNNNFFARMGQDGNFAIYNNKNFETQNITWSTNFHGIPGQDYHLRVQEDGNMVIYDHLDKAVWSSDSFGKGIAPYVLVMQDDGNLVLYDSLSNSIWASSTHSPMYSAQNPIPREGYVAPPAFGTHKEMLMGKEKMMGQQEQQFMSGMLSKLVSPAILKSSEFLRAPNRDFFVRLMEDGNLAIFTSSNFSNSNILWSSNSGGKGETPFQLRLQDDGNLVIFDRNNQMIWASGTLNQGSAPFSLEMQDDGNLVFYDRNHLPIWATDTANKFIHQQSGVPMQGQGIHQTGQVFNQI